MTFTTNGSFISVAWYRAIGLNGKFFLLIIDRPMALWKVTKHF